LEQIRPHFIYHLASSVVGIRDLELVLPTFHNNLTTTVNLLIGAAERGCERLVLAGSLEEPEQGEIFTIPCSPYAVSKLAGSAYASMFHALYQTPVVTARLFMVYGPGQKDLNKLIPYVTGALLEKEPPKISSGERPVDWIYIEDVIEGLMAMGYAPNIEGCVIDIGSGVLVTIAEVVEKLVNIIDPEIRPLFGALPDRPMEQVRVANIEDTADKIGWRPRVTLEKGLNSTVEWYKEKISKLAKH
jgi:nucleoside-diphosphate-sugar epimerase